MNLQLHHVVNDITGVTGLKIIRAILDGDRDPVILAKHRNPGCKNSTETLAKALHGNWREEHLFALRQAVELFDLYQQKIQTCDQAIEQLQMTGGHSFERKLSQNSLTRSGAQSGGPFGGFKQGEHSPGQLAHLAGRGQQAVFIVGHQASITRNIRGYDRQPCGHGFQQSQGHALFMGWQHENVRRP